MNDLPDSGPKLETASSAAKQEFLANWKRARESGAMGPELAVYP
jgi:hypothetical protein